MKVLIVKLDYSLLATIHRILKQRTDLNDRIERGPRKIRVAENAETQFNETLEAARENRKTTKMLADKKQLHLSSRESRIEDLKSKLNAADSNKEFQLLKDQIAADEQANSVLSDEILELLERIDGIEAEVKVAEKNLDKAKNETQKVKQTVATELASLNEQLESVVADLATNEKKLTGDAGAEYRRLAESRGEDALAKTDLQTCGHCYTKITTQTISELMMKEAVFCKSYGTLMYTDQKQAAGADS